MQNASGALRITGDPSGVIYLDAGHITFAQADWVPDLAARLRELRDVPPAALAVMMAGDDPGRDLGAQLVESKCLTKAALRAVLRSMIIDAMIVLTQSLPPPDETSIISTRFETPASHWSGQYARLGIDAAQALAEKKLAGLVRTGLSLTEPLELADLAGGWAVLKREHWQVASRINGQASVRELAWECGLSLTETIDCVSYLIRKGMCSAGLNAHSQARKQTEPAAGDVTAYDFAKGKKAAPRARAARPSKANGAATAGLVGSGGAAAGLAGSGGAAAAGLVGPAVGAVAVGPVGSNGAAEGQSDEFNGSAVASSTGSRSGGSRSGGSRSGGSRSDGSRAGGSRAGGGRRIDARPSGATTAGSGSAGFGSAGSRSAGRARVIPAGPVRGSAAARAASPGPDLDAVSDASQSAPSADQLRRVLDGLKKLT
jgi:uncharacterized protein DUF4388